MRISDWSSDVCSSDLPASGYLAARAESRPNTLRKTQGSLCEGPLLETLSGKRRAARMARRARRGAGHGRPCDLHRTPRRPRTGRRAGGIVTLRGRDACGPVARNAAIEPDGRKAVRSEEHTSEIQSLL